MLPKQARYQTAPRPVLFSLRVIIPYVAFSVNRKRKKILKKCPELFFGASFVFCFSERYLVNFEVQPETSLCFGL